MQSDPVCKKLPKTGNQQCDEYPFASTSEGAASGKQGVTWDVKAVPGPHSGALGTLISVMYSRQRFFYGDPFYVSIVP